MSCDVKHPGSGRHALLEVAAPLGRRCSVPSTPPDRSAKAVGAYDAARRAAWIATCVAGVCVSLVGACVTSVTWQMGDVETRSEDASGETLNVGYVVAATVLVLTLAALAHVALEYRKIVELLDLVEACTTDPAKIRGAVEEQVASRGGGCFGDVENYLFAGPVANVLARPPARCRRRGGERPSRTLVGGVNVAGSVLGGVDAAARARRAPVLAAAAADATAKTLDAVAALDIPDDPRRSSRRTSEGGADANPRRDLSLDAPQRDVGPRGYDFRWRGDDAAGGGSGGSSGGVAFELIGGLLLACGVMGAVAVEVTFCATRTVARAALRSLVETQAAAMRAEGTRSRRRGNERERRGKLGKRR